MISFLKIVSSRFPMPDYKFSFRVLYAKIESYLTIKFLTLKLNHIQSSNFDTICNVVKTETGSPNDRMTCSQFSISVLKQSIKMSLSNNRFIISASQAISCVLKARKHLTVHIIGIGGGAHWGEIEGSSHINTNYL